MPLLNGMATLARVYATQHVAIYANDEYHVCSLADFLEANAGDFLIRELEELLVQGSILTGGGAAQLFGIHLVP